jgi:hypothetical protein
MPEVLSPAQRGTLPARQALAAKFSSPEEKTEHYRQMAEKANAGRVVLSGAEAESLAEHTEALGEAYALLSKIAARARAKRETPNTESVA